MPGSRAWQRATTPPATASDITTAVSTKADTSAIPSPIPTGSIGYTIDSAAPSGWVLGVGRTIGSAASGGTERANADTAALFALIWALDATLYPIQTSAGGASTRGASAAIDFAANKRLPIPDLRGRVVAGKDDAGGTAASRLTTAGGGVDGTKIGATGGADTHTLTIAQMPAHTHAITALSARNTSSGGSENVANSSNNTTITSNSQGGGGAHPNAQPTLVATPTVKL